MAKRQELTPAERQELNRKLKDLTEMLPEYEDGPHLLAATENLLKQYGQL